MKANELRIGNFIKTVLNVVEVIGLGEERANLILRQPNTGVNWCMLYEDLSGIPLSEEILLKCGFIKTPHFTVMGTLNFDLGRNRSLSIGCVSTPNEMLFLREGDGKPDDDLIVLHNFDYDGKLYLHKLQNIVSIFGQEINTSVLI